MVRTSPASDHTLPLCTIRSDIAPTYSQAKGRKSSRPSDKPITASELKDQYAEYARGIVVHYLNVTFEDKRLWPVHGDSKAMTSYENTAFHTVTMRTTDHENKVWVYRGKGIQCQVDTFNIDEPTREELVRVMLERATGFDAAGNKVEITK